MARRVKTPVVDSTPPLPQGRESLKLARYSNHKGGRFTSLPEEFRAVAERRLQSMVARYTARVGHNPTQQKFASLVGNACAVTRNVDMHNPKFWSARAKRASMAALAKRRARAAAPKVPANTRSYWDPNVGA
jgi:hypothetical protein